MRKQTKIMLVKFTTSEMINRMEKLIVKIENEPVVEGSRNHIDIRSLKDMINGLEEMVCDLSYIDTPSNVELDSMVDDLDSKYFAEYASIAFNHN